MFGTGKVPSNEKIVKENGFFIIGFTIKKLERKSKYN